MILHAWHQELECGVDLSTVPAGLRVNMQLCTLSYCMTPEKFQTYARMSQPSFHELHDFIKYDIQPGFTNFRGSIPSPNVVTQQPKNEHAHSSGGIEEDFIKCLAPTYVGDFALKGRELRLKGINRTGNLLVPNSNYCKFEEWVMPIFDAMLEEQKEQGIVWTPSKVIARFGKEIDNPDSIYYWAYKNKIPVFCPALTDGALGDMFFFHSYKNSGLVVDLVEDIRFVNTQAVYAVNSGLIILGGGLIKHHTCNANLMRNGADFSVFVNTGNEFDGSDSGARPDEAISWGKIKITASPVKVHADASLIFPILVAETFAGRQKEIEEFNKRVQ
ncbi:deoxyhypusine synthase [Plakobranchus ocellatus]|uniref:deoxyhypusine synthase n=1 Tax=Plakobranchus ocellatus TaxID=259542 RepID=A0AAV4AG07_9GAST|nr:deoxyhypusine synthase [Plakobranchus ocellatus]